MIDIYSASSNLGDNLSLVPLMRATQCRLHLIDDPGVKSVATLFNGLGEIVYDNHERRGETLLRIKGPHSAKFLAVHELKGYSAIPKIDLTDEEISWARTFMKGWDLSKTCIIKASTSQINYRTPPAGLLDDIIEANPNITFFSFGLSTKHTKHNFHNVKTQRTYTFWDLDIRKQAAIYHIVGRYIGPDTGDYHLMLAVGGKTDVLVPETAWHYNHDEFHYTQDSFLTEQVRVKYHEWHKQITELLTGLNS